MTIHVDLKLPAVYLDSVADATTVGVILANEVPERDSIENGVQQLFVVDLITTTGFDLDISTVRITIDGLLAYEGGGFGFATEYSGPDSIVQALGGLRWVRFNLDRVADWPSEKVIVVRVEAEDTNGTALDETYQWTVADVTQPRLSQAVAVGPKTVRVTFDEPMLAVDPSGANDALNPSLFATEFVPENERQAGAFGIPVSVTQVSAAVFDVLLDHELSFWRTFRLVVGDIADDSPSANLVDPLFRSLEFESWVPPDWPQERDFQMWRLVSRDDRRGDTSGDLERLLSATDDMLAILCWDIDQWIKIIDIDEAPEERFVDAILFGLGNPFDFDLSLNRKRKLADLLPEIYRERGTAQGIINLARFFLGLTITIEIWNEDSWILGESELGISTILAPSASAERYTFVVESSTVLSDEDRSNLTRLIRQTKVAHEHFIIRDPSDAVVIEHLELGISLLGETWILH